MIKLFCLTYAGGTSKIFQGLSAELPNTIECIGIDYAGHGVRHKEPLYSSFNEMVQDISNQINRNLSFNDRIALLGYSMGSLVAYEIIAKNLLEIKPEKLFVAAHNAPSISSINKSYSTMTDEEFVEFILNFGGIDEVFLKNRRFWPIYLPPIKNDYRLLEQYDFDQEKRILNLGGGVFYSEEDTPYADIEPWKKVFSENPPIYKFKGSHFFLKKYENLIANIIAEAFI